MRANTRRAARSSREPTWEAKNDRTAGIQKGANSATKCALERALSEQRWPDEGRPANSASRYADTSIRAAVPHIGCTRRVTAPAAPEPRYDLRAEAEPAMNSKLGTGQANTSLALTTSTTGASLHQNTTRWAAEQVPLRAAIGCTTWRSIPSKSRTKKPRQRRTLLIHTEPGRSHATRHPLDAVMKKKPCNGPTTIRFLRQQLEMATALRQECPKGTRVR